MSDIAYSVMSRDTDPSAALFDPRPSGAPIQIVWLAINKALVVQARKDDRRRAIEMNFHVAVLEKLNKIAPVAHELQKMSLSCRERHWLR